METFRSHWTSDIRLVLYDEGFQAPACEQIRRAMFPRWFLDWKERYAKSKDAHGKDVTRNRPRKRDYDFKRDCVKFSHKVAALTDWALSENVWAQDEEHEHRISDLIVWMDADTVTHAKVTADWIEGLIFGGPCAEYPYMAWLDRQRLYPECGFLIFNARHARHVDFMRRLRHIYESGAVFDLSETHDSFVIQQLVLKCVAEGWFDMPRSLSGEARVSHHPFPLCELGSRLDHAKGGRKATGRTPAYEIAGRRSEGHWRT